MMQLLTEQPGFHERLIRRVETAEAERRAEAPKQAWYTGIAVAACAVAIALVVLGVLRSGPGTEHADTPVATGPAAVNGAAPAGGPSQAEDGTVPAEDGGSDEPELMAEAPAPDPESLEQATDLPLVVSGVVSGASPVATITVLTTGEKGVFGPGDTIIPGVTVAEILPRKVVVDHNGVLTVLSIGQAPAPDAPPIDGLWKARLLVNGEVVEEGIILSISEESGVLTVKEPGVDDLVAKGRLTGNYVVCEAAYQDLGPFALSGTFNETRTAGHVEGQIEFEGEVVACVCEVEKIIGADAVMRAELQSKEVRAMYSVLERYANGHDNRYPDALEELIPDYAADVSLFEDTEDRHVTYTSGLTRGIPAAVSQVAPLETFMPHLPFPDRLMARERALAQAWGGQFLAGGTLLKVTYEDPARVFTVGTRGVISDLTAATEQKPESAEPLLSSCQNNLKQLGLVCKMFQNECQDELLPPGWHTVYPEYLTDPMVLTCPKDKPGTMSYELLFPAANNDFFMRLHEAVAGPPQEAPAYEPQVRKAVAQSVAQSAVPIVVEKHEHVVPGGKRVRNVLFLDGHVNCLDATAWARMIEPYLKYK